jgi:hypothetical protein
VNRRSPRCCARPASAPARHRLARRAPVRREPAALLLSALGILVGGPACSLLNAPADLLPGPDAGTDMPGPDAGDLGADAAPKPVESCDDPVGMDEDMDGLANCADHDCAGLPTCCADGTNVDGTPVMDWDTALGSTGQWFAQPERSSVRVDGRVITGFGDAPGAVFLRPPRAPAVCVPLVAGMGFEVDLQAICGGGEDCGAAEAALVLTAAQGLARGAGRLAADLRVGLDGLGRPFVRVGTRDVPLLRADPPPSNEIQQIFVDVGPGAAEGVPVLVARVRRRIGSMDTTDLTEGEVPFVRLDRLLECGVEGAGLAVAIEGVGDGVSVRYVAAKSRQCANLSHFWPWTQTRRPGALALDTVLGVPPSNWRAGGVGAPAIAVSGSPPVDGGPRPAMELLYDATNVDRGLEQVAVLDFAIGGTTLIGDSPWAGSWMPRAEGGVPGEARLPATPARTDEGFPTCVSDCTRPRTSYREPALAFRPQAERTAGIDFSNEFVVARELEPFSDRYEIARVSFGALPGDAFTAQNRPLLEPATGSECAGPGCDPACVSLRDPAIARRPGSSPALLLYTCERANGPPTIRAVWLVPSGNVVVDGAVPFDLLTPEMLGDYARDGVRAPEVLVGRVRKGGPSASFVDAIRVWFTALRAGVATIGVADAVLPADAQSFRLTPYPANPVLTATSPALGPCDGACALTGLAVTRDLTRYAPENSPTYARFVVARRVDQSAGGTDWQLIPLEQVLGLGW